MGQFYNPQNVVVGNAAMYYAPFVPGSIATPPSAPGLFQNWLTPWLSPGSTNEGYSLATNADTNTVTIEEQAAAIGTFRSSAAVQITAAVAEETAANIALWANGYITSAGGVATVQTIAISGAPTGGTFAVTVPGYGTTAPLAYNVATTALATALSTLIGGTVTVTGTAGTSYVVTFPVPASPVSTMVVDGSLLTGGTTPTATVTVGTAGVAALNTITLTDDVLYYTVALEWRMDSSGRARRLYIPQANIVGTDTVAFRRAADKHMYGIQVTSACATNQIQIKELAAAAA